MNKPVTYTAEELSAAGLAPVNGTATAQPEEKNAGAQAPEEPPQAPKVEQPIRQTTVQRTASVVIRTGGEIKPLIPQTIDELFRFARMMAMTYNLPAAYYEEPKIRGVSEVDILAVATSRAMHAMQLGAEVGLPPAQAIQSILVLNGIGTIWGDALLGLVQASGQMEYFKEYTEGGNLWETIDKTDKGRNVPNRAYTWVFETKRKGREPVITRFSVADGIHAGIWGKKTWATHPERMGKYKARSFGLRDSYADVLKGLHSREEMEGETLGIKTNGDRITPENSAETLSNLLEHTPVVEMDLTKSKKPEAVPAVGLPTKD